MNSTRRPPANDTLYRRIDEMPMGISDRELAKARLRSAERFADGFCELDRAIRSCAAFIRRHVRTAFATSPQH